MVKWSPPPQGWLKINVDARLSIAKKRAVSDFIIRNDEEFIMGLGFQGHNLVHSVVIAEVLAMAPICTGFEPGKEVPMLSRFQFIVREGNGAAHVMAIEGMRAEGDLFSVEDVPLKALEVADSVRRSGRPP
ncbi:hypothetical protein Goshw_009000 [Gossypium schwendimanii]|uniref:RNase H type-1 domain-containing protein n=1 Tax=Gossypium schwendimanii TaxID=34291 RepID=A0A7J9NDY7_GOSSC|nr:hypothetical protein [Gossypium schwendimanii]